MCQESFSPGEQDLWVRAAVKRWSSWLCVLLPVCGLVLPCLGALRLVLAVPN